MTRGHVGGANRIGSAGVDLSPQRTPQTTPAPSLRSDQPCEPGSLDFESDVSARDKNAKSSYDDQKHVQVELDKKFDWIAGIGDKIGSNRHLPVHRKLTRLVPIAQSFG